MQVGLLYEPFGDSAAGVAYYTPAGSPPPGIVPDLTAKGPLAVTGLVIPTLYSVVVVLICSLRFFTKIYIMRRFDYEDYILVGAMITTVTYNTVCSNPYTSPGKHIWNVRLTDMNAWLYWANITVILWHPAIIFAKWAILVQLQRLFNMAKFSGSWWTVQILLYAATAGFIATMFSATFQCVPREAIWRRTVLASRCLNINYIFLASSVINTIVNIGVLWIPFWGLWKLQMQTKQKLAASAMLSFNVLALACSIGRMNTAVTITHTDDITYVFPTEAEWAGGELAWLIFATCFPTTRRFYKWWCDKSQSNSSGPIPLRRYPAAAPVAAPAPRPQQGPTSRIHRHWEELEDASRRDPNPETEGNTVTITSGRAEEQEEKGNRLSQVIGPRKRSREQGARDSEIKVVTTVNVDGQETIHEERGIDSAWFNSKAE